MENQKVFGSLTLEQVVDMLASPVRTLILYHVHPDGDAVGSAFALKQILELAGSTAYCVSADGIPERLAFAAKKYQSDAKPETVPAEFLDDKNLRIVTVDTASPGQLGRLYELFGDKIDLMIDHHSSGTPYADFYVEHTAATGEIIFKLSKIFEKKGLCTINAGIAECIYMAISSDTGCFRYSNCTPDTFRCAAELIETGIDIAEINRLLFEVKSKKMLAAESEGLRRIEYYDDGKLAILTFPYRLKAELGLENEHLETLVDVARTPEGVLVAAAIRQPEAENVFRVSMRSSCNFDVSAVCAELGGGGHVRAAGCTIKADGIERAAEMIRDVTERHMKESGI